jgi:integrase
VQILDTRVNTFLSSIGRNSKNSRKSYQTALIHFAEFIKSKKQTPDSIIPLLEKQRINTYELLDQFVSYLSQQQGIAAASLKLYMAVIRSYLQYNDIDISNSKFKRKVKMPKVYSDPEEPLSLSDIRELLEFNNNRRLNTYIILLASTGLRAMEAASLRLMDFDFSVSPTRINIRKETTKTKRGRVIYCSNEATKHLQKLVEIHSTKKPQDLIFAIRDTKDPIAIYVRVLEQFEKLLHIAGKDQRKENSKRREITLHSFRRTAFSIINEQTNSEYANWFLGHNHSVYWTHKEQERRELYLTKCMPFLTIYQETRDNTIENALREKDMTIKLLTNRITDIELHQKEQSEILKHLTPEKLQKIMNS